MNLSSPRILSPLARAAGIALVAGALTQLILTASASAKGDPLEAGKPREREISNGETHIYEIFVLPGSRREWRGRSARHRRDGARRRPQRRHDRHDR